MLKVHFDRNLCSGHAQCHSRCPSVYGLDDLGYAVILQETPSDELREDVLAGAAACPEKAITVTES